MSTSPYDQPPQGDAPDSEQDEDQGSIESALAGDYDFEITDILEEAWQSIDGYKLPFAIVSSIYFAIYLLVILPLAFLLGDSAGAQWVMQAVGLLFVPMNAAFFMMGIRMARGEALDNAMLFAHYDKLLPLVGLQIAISLAVMLGLVMLIIPGIYIAIAVMFAMPLMVEKNLSILDAFETSRKAVTFHWFKFFLLMLAMMLITLISILPLGIGLFWTMPMMVAMSGILYRRVFGVGQAKTSGSLVI